MACYISATSNRSRQFSCRELWAISCPLSVALNVREISTEGREALLSQRTTKRTCFLLLYCNQCTRSVANRDDSDATECTIWQHESYHCHRHDRLDILCIRIPHDTIRYIHVRSKSWRDGQLNLDEIVFVKIDQEFSDYTFNLT